MVEACHERLDAEGLLPRCRLLNITLEEVTATGNGVSACSFELVVAQNVLHLYPKEERSAVLKRLIQPLQLQGGLLLSAYSQSKRPGEVELVMMTARTRLAARALPPDQADALLSTLGKGRLKPPSQARRSPKTS
jgi:hypothetical protein